MLPFMLYSLILVCPATGDVKEKVTDVVNGFGNTPVDMLLDAICNLGFIDIFSPSKGVKHFSSHVPKVAPDAISHEAAIRGKQNFFPLKQMITLSSLLPHWNSGKALYKAFAMAYISAP